MSGSFEVVVLEPALVDIQAAIDFYDEQQIGLGRRFETELNQFLTTIETLPFFQVRYNIVRCLPLKRFPFMVHFSVLEEECIVQIHAVLHTSMSPDNWKP